MAPVPTSTIPDIIKIKQIYMNGKLNKYAYNITGRVVKPTKYLDGSMRVPVWVKTYSGGQPVHERVELWRDCVGNWSIINSNSKQ